MRKLLITSCFVALGVTGYHQTANAQIRLDVTSVAPDFCDSHCQEARRYERYEQDARRDQNARREEWREEHRVDPGDEPRYDGPHYDYR